MLIPGLDRLPNTPLEGMDDALWLRHTTELQAEFSKQSELGFAAFCAEYASLRKSTLAMREHQAATLNLPLPTLAAYASMVPAAASGSAL
eukprot:m.150258 g.150258  ORF g.150258 m.150258 type:complete len:90 (+) comp23291_c0_seq1:277-546(+)